MSESSNPTPFAACPDCDLLHEKVELTGRSSAHCVRCGARIGTSHERAHQRSVAYLLASLILFAAANLFPFLSLFVSGVRVEARLLAGALELYREGFWIMSLSVLVACFIAPLLHIVGMLVALMPPRGGHLLRRWVGEIRPWAMLDVFMLGVLVAMVKLVALADVGLEHGFFAYIALVVVATMAGAAAEPLWISGHAKH